MDAATQWKIGSCSVGTGRVPASAPGVPTLRCGGDSLGGILARVLFPPGIDKSPEGAGSTTASSLGRRLKRLPQPLHRVEYAHAPDSDQDPLTQHESVRLRRASSAPSLG